MNSFKIRQIRQTNLGAKLAECREEKNLSLEDVYRICNIPVKYLKFLEEERWNDLPGEIYLKNFLKKYCSILNLNFKLCFQQYQIQITTNSNHIKSKIESNSRKQKINFNSLLEFINPQRFKIIVIVIVLIIFLGYLYFKISNYVSPPDLIITYPQGNFETTDNIITISGQTEIEAMVSINSENIPVEENGNFSGDVKLKYGLNRFVVTSQRKHGQPNEQEIIILKKQISEEKELNSL